jgi:hypothetical protein
MFDPKNLTFSRRKIGYILCDLAEINDATMENIIERYFGAIETEDDAVRKQSSLIRVQVWWLRRFAAQNNINVAKAYGPRRERNRYAVDRPDALRQLLSVIV